MELKKNWNSNGNIARGDRLQLRGFCLGQTDSMYVMYVPVHVNKNPEVDGYLLWQYCR